MLQIFSPDMDFGNIIYQFSFFGLETEAELFFRVLLAALAGLVIGNERKNQHKAAGARTHAIVALGAALVLVLSVHGFEDAGGGDAARMAAQVVCGVGFLGAGLIFVRSNSVKGLTTAAGIWTTAGIGLAFGAGMYLIAAASSVLILIVHKYPGAFVPFADPGELASLKIHMIQNPGIIGRIQTILQEYQIEVESVHVRKIENGEMEMKIELVYPGDLNKDDFMIRIAGNQEVQSIAEEIL